MGAGDFATVEAVADYLRRVSHVRIRKGKEQERAREELVDEERVTKEESHTRFTGAPVNEYLIAPQRQEPVIGLSVTVMLPGCLLKAVVISDGREDRRFLYLNMAEMSPESGLCKQPTVQILGTRGSTDDIAMHETAQVIVEI